MALQFPIINGVFKSWANILTSIAGKDYTNYKSVKWDESVEMADVYGAGPLKLGTTRGNGKPGTVSIEMYLDEADAWENALASQPGVPTRAGVYLITYPQFPLLIQWSDFAGGPVSTCSITGCRIAKRGNDNSQGNDATTRSYDLNVMSIVTQRKGAKKIALI